MSKRTQRLIGSKYMIAKMNIILEACTKAKTNLEKANANRDKLSVTELMDAVEQQMIPLSALYDTLMGVELVTVDAPAPTKANVPSEDTPYPPRYKHDCTSCIYLGQLEDFDLYYCPQGGRIPTVIAKHGDDEYLSGMNSDYFALVEAQRLAVERGLINPDGTIKG